MIAQIFARVFNPKFQIALAIDLALIAATLYVYGWYANMDLLRYYLPFAGVYTVLHAIVESVLPW